MPETKTSFHHLLGPGFPTRNLSKGKTIFREGDRGDEFFVVVRGKVEIISGDRHFETLEADGIFGEMALIDDSPRSAQQREAKTEKLYKFSASPLEKPRPRALAPPAEAGGRPISAQNS